MVAASAADPKHIVSIHSSKIYVPFAILKNGVRSFWPTRLAPARRTRWYENFSSHLAFLFLSVFIARTSIHSCVLVRSLNGCTAAHISRASISAARRRKWKHISFRMKRRHLKVNNALSNSRTESGIAITIRNSHAIPAELHLPELMKYIYFSFIFRFFLAPAWTQLSLFLGHRLFASLTSKRRKKECGSLPPPPPPPSPPSSASTSSDAHTRCDERRQTEKNLQLRILLLLLFLFCERILLGSSQFDRRGAPCAKWSRFLPLECIFKWFTFTCTSISFP